MTINDLPIQVSSPNIILISFWWCGIHASNFMASLSKTHLESPGILKSNRPQSNTWQDDKKLYFIHVCIRQTKRRRHDKICRHLTRISKWIVHWKGQGIPSTDNNPFAASTPHATSTSRLNEVRLHKQKRWGGYHKSLIKDRITHSNLSKIRPIKRAKRWIKASF